MTARAMYRGHTICWTDDGWVYADGGEPSTVEKPCAHCGREVDHDEPDPCIGMLPGVKAACCGHGNTEDAYIVLDCGFELRGLSAIVLQDMWVIHKLGTVEREELTRDIVKLFRTLFDQFT